MKLWSREQKPGTRWKLIRFKKLGCDSGNSLAPFSVAWSIGNTSSPEQSVDMGKLRMWQSSLSSPGLFYWTIKLIVFVFWILLHSWAEKLGGSAPPPSNCLMHTHASKAMPAFENHTQPSTGGGAIFTNPLQLPSPGNTINLLSKYEG